MTDRRDLVVIGAGPAGSSAAIEARRYGLDVVVLDENRQAGGQVWRAPNFIPDPGYARAHREYAEGEALRESLAASGAELLFGHSVWLASPELRIGAASASGSRLLDARAVVVATGATERVVPFPGWTLPGVIGLAAATILIKAHATVPAGPMVVAGVGPLLYAVATGLIASGGKVAAVVDLVGPAQWLQQLPGLASRPDLLSRGMAWMARLRLAGIPMWSGHTVVEALGDDQVREVRIQPVDGDWRVRPERPAVAIPAAGLAIGHGLQPATEIARSLGVRHAFDRQRGGWIPEVEANRSSAVAGVRVAGDCTGISGVDAARHAGQLAGLSAAFGLGALSEAQFTERARPIAAKLRRAEQFGHAVSRLMTLRPGLVEDVAKETMVCRCEQISRSGIELAAKNGARHVNQLKSATRCGMGPCQGRFCAETTADILARTLDRPRPEVGTWTIRPPLRPVPLDRLVGSFAYDDIPSPPQPPA